MSLPHGHFFSRLNQGRRLVWMQRIGLAVAATLVVSLTDVPEARPAVAAPAPPKPAPKPACPDDRQDVASAAIAAKLCSARVEAVGERSETSQVFVNPDGTVTEERALAPVRVRVGEVWQPVDLTLARRADGSVAPRVHPRALSFAGAQRVAGEHEVVSLGSGDERTTVAWNGVLPEPVLAGSTVTYPEVMSGVDLVFTAHATGYEQFFVAKNAAALRHVEELTLPVRTGKLTAAGDGAGGLVFKDGRGEPVGRAQAPEMWDAKVSPGSLEHVNRAKVGLSTVQEAGRTVMTLTADEAFLDRKDLTFPVTIDPPSSLPVAFDAFVQNGWTGDQSGSADLKLGHVVEDGAYTARSYLRFGTSGLWGSRVTSAKLRLWNYHSWSCTASSWEAWRTDRADASVRWTNQPAAREKVGTSTETKGYNASCGDGWVYVDVAKALQSAADSRWNDVTVMLRGTNEGDTKSWKRFHSAEGANPPSVSITYNAAPGAPTGLAVAPCYTSCGGGARTSSLRPTLSAKLADANAGQALRAEFEVQTASGTAVAGSGVLAGNPGWTNGSTASWQVNKDLANGTVYRWRVRAKDPYNDGGWTGWQELTVDTDKPLVPFVSAGIYLNDGQPHGGAGQADTFTFRPADGTSDLAAFVYRLDTDASATTLAATGQASAQLSPRDGQRTLTVQAKDRAGNLSAPNTYVFSAGSAALAQPLPGANIVKRTKLQIFTPVTGYTRTFFEYRRGPGGATLPVPSTNLTSATGAPVTATAASPVAFSALGGYAIWNAADTLGLVGGVVEVRARIYTATSTAPVYDTPWVRVTVDSSGDGGAGEEVGPGVANLLTGDLSLSGTDADELNLSVSRTASSRSTGDGWVAMPQKLTANQRQVSTDLTGFTVPATSTAVRSTARGQGETSPADSIEITPAATGTNNDTYVTVGGDTGALRLGMQPGRTYRMTGWVFVPAATGLAPANTRGLRIVGFTRVGSGAYVDSSSAMAAYTEGWQELSVDMTVPAGATEALFRLYNGNAGGTGRRVHWDNLSFTEIIAPFGPSWNGAATGGAADSDYTTLSFPQPSIAQVNTAGGGWITFSRNADGTSFTPEPGNEGVVLSKPDAQSFRIAEHDGSVSEFTQQGGVWAVTSTWTDEDASTTRFMYDTAGGRLLLKRVVNPTEPGVDDAGRCTGAVLARGCEVLEYVYATATTPALSDTVFGDFADRVSAVKIWTWDPDANAVNAVEVTRYAYDNVGRLREVWDPRVAPALKTAYAYDGVGRIVKATPPGELPWTFDYANPDVDAAALRWDLDGSATDSSGAGRNGTVAGASWGQANDPDNTGDRAAVFPGAASAHITASGAPLSNTSSYTVSAWVRLTDKGINRTAVSKDGSRTSGFFLNYVAEADRWAFSRVTVDGDSATPVRATSNVSPALGAWTHLTGVYDTAAGKMKLYVNGVLQSTQAATGGWNATGNYVVGRAKWAGAPANPWAGGIDDVRVYGAALTDAQVLGLAGDENSGRLIRVRRAAIKPGSRTDTDGELGTSIVYNVPLTKAAGGPHDLHHGAITTWGQTDLPTDATAIFGPEDVPARSSATPSVPGPSGYRFATVHYLNAGGQEVNTASPAGDIDTQEYDRFGNVIRSLQATDRALALGTLPDGTASLAELGLLNSDSASRAQALSTVNRYSSDGVELLDTVGPTASMVLERGVEDPDSSGPLPAIEPGSTVIARAKSTKMYDEGKPDGAAYHLVTTEIDGAQIDGYPLADVRVSKNGYDAEHGGVSGWVIKQATKVIADAGPGGEQKTAYAVFNKAGQVLKSWGIDSTGTDARSSETLYYSAGVHDRDASCGNRPEWAGEPCITRAVGSVSGHDPNRMTSELPVRRVAGYHRFGDETQVTETGGGKSRTTSTTYDLATRALSVVMTSDEGASLPAVTTQYDPVTGDATVTTMGDSTITREYDALGRLASYTDADGGTTTNEFDRFGKATKVSDPTGSSTFVYDRTIDPRGQLTSVTDSVAGTFDARYSPDGQLTVMKYPGGLTRTDRLDANLQPAERTYTRDSDGAVIYSESVVENTAGQWVNHQYTGGRKTYAYDRLGRLTKVQQDSDVTDGCVTRTYGFDSRTNRTNRATFNPDDGGTCNTEGVDDERIHRYDTADRIVDDGYVYDAFGRTTQLPGGLTNAYWSNDLVQRQELGDARQSWSLDPAHRFRGFTTETKVDGTWVNASSKLNHYGDDSDEVRWIVEDTSLGTITRNVSGPDGDLGATTSRDGDVRLQLTNLHGDIAVTIDPGLSEPELYDYDEFGVPMPGQADQRYGWLGGKQRSGDALGDVILMGVRLYSPSLGRFLQVDPVDGGNATAYDYCAGDPVNCTDLDGKWGWGSIKRGLSKVAKIASYASMIPGPIGTIAGIVSAVSYAATGNWREAAWAFAGAAAAVVGAGAAVKGARLAVGAARAAARARKATSRVRKAHKVWRRGCNKRRNSFEPATQVLMANGYTLPISEVQIGDYVLATDPDSGVSVSMPVLDTIVGQGTRELVDVTVVGEQQPITATAGHEFFVSGRGWTEAGQLLPGDLLTSPGGASARVTAAVHRGFVADRTVYNLTVGELHTFQVFAGGTPVLVHNCADGDREFNTIHQTNRQAFRAAKRHWGVTARNRPTKRWKNPDGRGYMYNVNGRKIIIQHQKDARKRNHWEGGVWGGGHSGRTGNPKMSNGKGTGWQKSRHGYGRCPVCRK